MTIKLYELVGTDASRPFSPHCWKVRMALAHKRLEHEIVPVRFTEIPEIENGGQTTVPLIRHGEKLISDSFQIALYLRETYPDRVGHLFLGEGSIGLSRFVETWTQSQLHPWIARWATLDIHNMLDAKDQAYFRENREKRFGMSLEAFVAGRDERAGQLKEILTPVRLMLKHQDFLGGRNPIFADYIVFSALQWLRICSGLSMWDLDDPARAWFERLLDLHDGLGRSVPEASR